jgi:hypothetical protein
MWRGIYIEEGQEEAEKEKIQRKERGEKRKGKKERRERSRNKEWQKEERKRGRRRRIYISMISRAPTF